MGALALLAVVAAALPFVTGDEGGYLKVTRSHKRRRDSISLFVCFIYLM